MSQARDRSDGAPSTASTALADSTPAAGSTLSRTRRNFLKASLAAGGGLLLSLELPRRAAALEGHAAAAAGVADAASAPAAASGAVATTATAFAPNAFIRIAPDGHVTLISSKIEMGQGAQTGLAMLIAEELEASPAMITVENAPPDEKLYAEPLLHMQVTGGSTSVRGAWEPLRRAGAAARMMLVAAAAQRWQVAPDSCSAQDGQVRHAPSGRSLGYGELASAAAGMPVPENVTLKQPGAFKLIGTPMKRFDTPSKVNGSAIFTIDIRLPGMLIATVAACPVFGGRLASVDDTKARTLPGVRQVVRLDDAVAVVGDHMWAAKQGLAALEVHWTEGPHAQLSSDEVDRRLAVAAQRAPIVATRKGNAAAALQQAASKVEAVYDMPFLAHAAMEPMSCVAHVRPDACELWVGSQVPTRAQAIAAKLTGLPPEKIQVHNQYIGGAFGRRLEIDFIAQAVNIAKQVNAPVKLIWTREEDIQHDMYRPRYHDRLSAGLDAQGHPVAWLDRITSSSVMARFAPPALRKDGLDEDAVEGAAQTPYTFPNMQVEWVREEPPGLVTAFWRGVGPTHNVFVVESFMDELAAAAKQDPVQYRRALLKDSPRALRVLDVAAQKAGWGTPRPEHVGLGVAVALAFGSYVAQVVEVAVAADGGIRVKRVVCAVDCGFAVNPDEVRAQVEGGMLFGLSAALFNDITLKNGRVEQSNFNDYRQLRINETPAIEVYLVHSGDAPGGIGETGTVCAAPALCNAVFAASGKRVRRLPLVRAGFYSA